MVGLVDVYWGYDLDFDWPNTSCPNTSPRSPSALSHPFLVGRLPLLK